MNTYASQTVSLHTALPWHERPWNALCDIQKAQRLAHAYLITGHYGIGKKHFALNFAHYVLCSNKQQNRPCGHCKSCHLNAAQSHPDLLLIEGKNTPSNAIKIDQIRNLLEYTNKTAQQSGYRIAILNTAEILNNHAANALLKRLEEPGDQSLLLLLSDQPDSVLPTIRSRCQVFHLAQPHRKDAFNWLENNINPSKKHDLETLLYFSNDAPLAAKQLAESLEESIDTLLTGLIALSKGQRAIPDVALDLEIFDSQQLVHWVMLWTTSMIKYASTQDTSWLPDLAISKLLKYVADKAGEKQVFLFYQWLLEINQNLKKHIYLNKLLFIESILARWVDLIMKTTL